MASDSQLIEDVTLLRTQMRANPRLQLEFKAALSFLLRQHDIDVAPETLAGLTVAVYPELQVRNTQS